MVIGETIGWRLQEPSADNIAPVVGCLLSDEAMAAAKRVVPMFRRSGGLNETGGFSRSFKWQAHLDPAGREGSACRLESRTIWPPPAPMGIEVH